MAEVATGAATIGGAGVTPPVNPGASGAGSATNDWMSGFNDDQKGYVLNKGFKTPGDVLDSYRNFEKLKGVSEDRLLKLPDNMDTPEGRAIWEKLGMPKEAKEYGIEIPKEGGDAKLMETFVGAFHEAGITKSAAQKIVSKWNDFQNAKKAEMAENQKAAFTTQDAALKKEWGAAYEQNLNIAKEAARVLGLNAQQVDAMSASMGHDGVTKLLNKLGSATREGTYIQGSGAANAILAPEQAKSQIKALTLDSDFRNRLEGGDFAAKAKWTELHKQAWPGEYNF